MRESAANGLTVIRTWAFGVTKQYALQISPGIYNEAIFRGLDYVLDVARQEGIKVHAWARLPESSHADHDRPLSDILLPICLSDVEPAIWYEIKLSLESC